MDNNIYFTAKLWVYTGPSAWHFLTCSTEAAEHIRFFRGKHHGFGTISVNAKIGSTEWRTSLFPDKQSHSFLLPVKAEVRKKENLSVGKDVSVRLTIYL